MTIINDFDVSGSLDWIVSGGGISGSEWVALRGPTVWLPIPAMMNADGTIRRRWFS